jgi:hypothetical protein
MRILMVFPILIAVAACAPQQAKSQVAQVPTTIVVSSGTPISPVVGFGTSQPLCPCPSGVIPPGPSQMGVIGGTPVICNCPALILPPTISATDVGSTPTVSATNDITLQDNGKTFIFHPGESFLLNLGMDVFNWTVEVDNQNVLSRLINVMVIRGAQGIYEANNPGQAVLTAVGDPFCRSSVPACGAPSMLFKITVIVK